MLYHKTFIFIYLKYIIDMFHIIHNENSSGWYYLRFYGSKYKFMELYY